MNIKKILFASFFTLIISLPLLAIGGNVFYSSALIYIEQNGVKEVGTADSQNAKARALTYRNGIIEESSFVNANPPEWGGPAYTSDEVGSSVFKTSLEPGQELYITSEVYSGLNGWQGASYIGGAHQTMTSSIISNLGDDENDPFPHIVLEKIPKVEEQSHKETSLTLKWEGLQDRTDVFPNGEWNDSISGYTVYRSANDTEHSQKIGVVPQKPGDIITFVDDNVSQGVNYYYQIAVNFRWDSNLPNPWYETTARSEWSSALYTSDPADAIKFSEGSVTEIAGQKAGPITISSYITSTGNISNTPVSIKIDLSSDSLGDYSFFEFDNACTENEITQLEISAGTNSASFCYKDTKQGSPTVTATPQNNWNAISQSQTVLVGPLDHFSLNFRDTQTNDEFFSGTNTITAMDLGGNIITDYNEAQKWMGASVLANGNSFNLDAEDFVNGVADLTAKNFKYTGKAGLIIFEAVSDNGKKGSAGVNIEHGSLDYVKILNQAGEIVADYSITVDDVLELYATGYDVSDNYFEISGEWSLLSGDLEGLSFEPNSMTIDPSIAFTSGKIKFASDQKIAETGLIEVSHGALDHFEISQNIQEQIAGNEFNLGEVLAKDAENNLVKSFNSAVSLSSESGTISPKQTSNFSQGVLSAQNVILTLAGTDTVSIDFEQKSAKTNIFQVRHNSLDHFYLDFKTPQKNDKFFEGENKIIAQDEFNNTVLDFNEKVNIESSGEMTVNDFNFLEGTAKLASKIKYTGKSGDIEFEAKSLSEKSGKIVITIEPGDLKQVIIKETSNGKEAQDHLMKVGESYELYASGYDVSANYISDIEGLWESKGSLDSLENISASHITFSPMLANSSGAISFTSSGGYGDETGNIIVKRGDLDHLKLNFEEQIDGVSFTGKNELIAQDAGNNIITDFNQIGENVVLSVENNAVLTNNVFNPSDFVNGVADISEKGLIYKGEAGEIEIKATAGQKQGVGLVNIKVGALDHFDVSFDRIQDNNKPFKGSNMISAKDIGGNTITNFNALVDNVTLTLEPDVGIINGLGSENNHVLNQVSDFVNGVANLTDKLIYDGMEGTYIFKAVSDSQKIGLSENVEISIGPLDHFVISKIEDNKAGNAFSINIMACDITGNIKTSFHEAIDISDLSGTIQPIKTPVFEGGGVTFEAVISKAMNNITVSANYGEIEGVSNSFKIINNDLHHFAFEKELGQVLAGQEFDLGKVIAQDQFNNTVLDFNESTTLSDSTKTIEPLETNSFENGVLENQAVRVTKSRESNIIKIDFEEKIGTSNAFKIIPNELDHILIKTSADGGGDVIDDYVLTTDDSLLLYAAAYDEFENYINDTTGHWETTGDLDTLSSDGVSFIEFKPLKAQTSGTITFNNGRLFSTGTISVNHGALDHFEVNITSPQTVGEVLTGANTLTALDKNKNIVTEFNAFKDNVSIKTSSEAKLFGMGSENNHVLNQKQDFKEGVASLDSLIYAGTASEVIFEAESASLKTGASEKVLFISGKLDHFDLIFEGVQKNGEFFTDSKIYAKDMGGNLVTDFDSSKDSLELMVQPNNGVLSFDILNQKEDFKEGVADLSEKLKYEGRSGLHTFKAVSNNTQKMGTSSEVDIQPGELSYIKIIDSPDGSGEEINEKELLASESLELWTAGFDKQDNFIKNYSVKWIGQGQAFGNLSNLQGVKTVFSPIEAGEAIVHAQINDLSAKTGLINIKAGKPAKIVFTNYAYDGEYINDLEDPHSNNAPLIEGEASGKITIELQDMVGNTVGAENDLIINLETDSSSGSFSKLLEDWTIEQVTILKGQNSVSFYYKDNLSGYYEISAFPVSESINPNSQKVKVVSKNDQKLVFKTAPQTISAGKITEIITIELQDNTGKPVLASDNIALSFASNCPSENHFYADPNGSFNVSSANISKGESSISFYYQDYYANRSLITLSAEGLTKAYQIVEVLPASERQLFIVGGEQGQNIVQNQLSQKIIIQLKDQYGNLAKAKQNFSVNLSSENPTGLFLTPENTGLLENNPSLILKAGENQAYFYYQDSVLGEVQISAGEASQIETIVLAENTISQIVFTTPERKTSTNTSSEMITIQLQDAFSNGIPTTEEKTVSLFSNASSGSFALSPSGPWGIDSVIIESGSSEASFYYKDEVPGSKTLGVSETPSQGYKDAVQKITIDPNPVHSLSFTSDVQSILANQSSSAITLALLDENNNPTFYTEDVNVVLSTNSESGTFALNNIGSWDLSLVTIPANTSFVKFYYKEGSVGTYILSAKTLDYDWQEAHQTISVRLSPINRLSFTSDVQAISSSKISQKITVETQDEQGNARPVDSDTVIEIKSSSAGGTFSLNGTDWGICSAIIKKGANSIEFYYKDEGVGVFTLTASEAPEKGWKNAVQQISVGELDNRITKLLFTSEKQNIKAGEVSALIKLETVSIINRPINTEEDTEILVVSDSIQGEFSKSIEGPWEKNLILTIASGENLSEFYYRDSSVGEFNLFAREYPDKGWGDALQKIKVETGEGTKLVFITPKQSILKNRTSSILTVQAQDNYGNIKTVEEDFEIQLSSSSSLGQFSLDFIDFKPRNSINILAGNSSVNFYYKDSSIGSFDISAKRNDWTEASQLITVSEDVLDHIVLLPETGAAQINSNFQFTAIAYNALNTIIPDVAFKFEMVNANIGTIDEKGLFKANASTGAYKNAIKVSANGKEALASMNIFGSIKEAPSSSSGGGVFVVHEEVPLNASVVINKGDFETLSPKVKLNTYATGATHMKISNSADFSSAKTWLPYSALIDWELKGDLNENNIVYVKFKNLTGGESATANDSIKFVEKLSTNVETPKEPQQLVYNYYIVKPSDKVTATSINTPHIVSPISGALVLNSSIYLTGYAEPNTLITLNIHSENQIIAKVVSDSEGKFVYKIEPNMLEPGSHSVFASTEKDNQKLVGPTTYFEIFSEDKQKVVSNTNEDVVLTTSVEVASANKLVLNIDVLNSENKSGEIIYKIKDSKGAVVSSYKEDFKTKNKNIQLTKAIKIPQKLDSGKYVFETQFNGKDDKIVNNINNFEISKSQSEKSFYGSSIFKTIILAWFILIAIIAWGGYKIFSYFKK